LKVDAAKRGLGLGLILIRRPLKPLYRFSPIANIVRPVEQDFAKFVLRLCVACFGLGEGFLKFCAVVAGGGGCGGCRRPALKLATQISGQEEQGNGDS
jgi:hypothetical protein